VPASDALMQSVKAHLEQRYGSGLDVGFAVNPALIGGLRVKVGSDVFDGSVKGRLASLEESF
jgi:F-type H+-transporting ATPase subunit delta